MKNCAAQLVICSIIILASCGGSSSAVLNHPKLRRSVNSLPKNSSTSTFIVVWKDSNHSANSSIRNVSVSDLMGRVQEASNGSSGGGEDIPMVENARDNGIGVTADMNQAALERVLEMEEVGFVEENQMVYGAVGWHVDRIDQRQQTLNGQYNPPFTGKGVDIYVMDSGIRYTHSVFEGRAYFGGYDYDSGQGRDCNGHGTHCAGLAAGKGTGVAYEANVFSVKVLDCNLAGNFAWIIDGLNHIRNKVALSGRRAVVSMSFIGGKSDAFEVAARQAYYGGIVLVSAAGNQRSNACQYSPSSSPYVISVGATKKEGDKLYWFSTFSSSPGTNYGSCVDVFAPGQGITSAAHTGDNSYVPKSGTSMAAPIVAGAAALLLQKSPRLTPYQVRAEIRNSATRGVLDFSVLPASARRNTQNLLVFTGQQVDPPLGPTDATSPTTDPIPTGPGSEPTSPLVSETTAPTTTAATPLTVNETLTNATEPPPPINVTDPPTPNTTGTTPSTTGTTPTSTTATPIPTLPLPMFPSFMMQALPVGNLYSQIRSQKSRGYVPTFITAYKIIRAHYYAIIFSYIGIDRVGEVLTYKDLSPQTAYDLIENRRQKGYAVIALAPYNRYGPHDPVVTLIFKNDTELARTTYVSMERNVREHVDEERELRRLGYAMLYRRFRQTGLNSNSVYMRVYTIYRPGTFKNHTGLLYRSSLKSFTDKLAAKGKFLIDVSTYDYRGLQHYSAIYDDNRFGCDVFRTEHSPDGPSFSRESINLRQLGYHIVAFVPVKREGSAYPEYFGTYWQE